MDNGYEKDRVVDLPLSTITYYKHDLDREIEDAANYVCTEWAKYMTIRIMNKKTTSSHFFKSNYAQACVL